MVDLSLDLLQFLLVSGYGLKFVVLLLEELVPDVQELLLLLGMARIAGYIAQIQIRALVPSLELVEKRAVLVSNFIWRNALALVPLVVFGLGLRRRSESITLCKYFPVVSQNGLDVLALIDLFIRISDGYEILNSGVCQKILLIAVRSMQHDSFGTVHSTRLWIAQCANRYGDLIVTPTQIAREKEKKLCPSN